MKCKQDGTKSGGEIINDYCSYHKKYRKNIKYNI